MGQLEPHLSVAVLCFTGSGMHRAPDCSATQRTKRPVNGRVRRAAGWGAPACSPEIACRRGRAGGPLLSSRHLPGNPKVSSVPEPFWNQSLAPKPVVCAHSPKRLGLSPQNKNHFPVAENRAILLSSACCPAGGCPHLGQELTESWRKARAASSPRPESACAAPSQAAGARVQGVGAARPGPVTIRGLSASSLERPHLNMAGRRLPRYTRVQMRCSLPAAPKTSASDCAALAPLTRFNWAFEAGKTIRSLGKGGIPSPTTAAPVRRATAPC